MKSLFKRSTILALALVPVLLTGCTVNDVRENEEESQYYSEDVSGENDEDTSSVEDVSTEDASVEDVSTEEVSAEEQDSDSDAADYPVIETSDYSDLTLDYVENGSIGYSFPADEWVPGAKNPLKIILGETQDSNNKVNIEMSWVNTEIPDNWVEEFQPQFRESLLAIYLHFLNFDCMEARLLNGEPVIYTEMNDQVTDEMLDQLIEQGIYTEAQIEALGGREDLIAFPPTSYIVIYAVRDGYYYVCTGTYYEESQKQMVFDTMAIIMDTVEKL